MKQFQLRAFFVLTLIIIISLVVVIFSQSQNTFSTSDFENVSNEIDQTIIIENTTLVNTSNVNVESLPEPEGANQIDVNQSIIMPSLPVPTNNFSN